MTYTFSACFCCLWFDRADKSVFSSFIVSYSGGNAVYNMDYKEHGNAERDLNVNSVQFL